MTPDEIDDWLGSVYTRTVNCDFREQQEVIDVLNYGTTRKRYYVNNDEIKVERIDPRTAYYEYGNERWVMILKAGINDYGPRRPRPQVSLQLPAHTELASRLDLS